MEGEDVGERGKGCVCVGGGGVKDEGLKLI